MKNKSTLLKIRKSKIFNILVTTGEKNPCKNILFFEKFEESLQKVSDRSERKMVVKGLRLFFITFQACLNE